jgi:hypothetical protein
MKLDRALIGGLLIGILSLAPLACGFSLSVSSDAGGFAESINAGPGDSVYGSTVIGAEGLSNSIRGSGSLKERHGVSNTAGASAGVGVDIRNAESYNYGYSLMPGPGFRWPASRYPAVSAGETLDVVNAKYIYAYADAVNAQGDAAGVSTILSDPGKKASLVGYSNTAGAAPNKAAAIQTAENASAMGGSIQTEADSQLNQLRLFPLELRMEKTDASTTVKAGSVNGYTDKAAVLNHEIVVSQQQIDSASGNQINIDSKSTFYFASLFGGLKKSTAEASTMTFGDLTGYDGISKVTWDLVEAQQSGHIVGTFASTETAGKFSKTRSSNYGNEYDLNMQARKDASGSSATGLLGYYVDSDDLVANKIQGAVDASESGDTINVAGGIYYENVQIDKSLSIKGDAGSDPSSETVVDGQMNGSVFTIGKDNPHIEVSLQNVIIQNGSGTYMEKWPGYPPVQFGGGVWNLGTLSIVSSLISGNTANGYGCGIWSTGNLTVESSSIEGNDKSLDGGGIWSSGNLIVDSSIITGNEAHWNGGGIWSSGNMILENSYVGGNTANLYGGGVANDLGQATVKGSTISGNNAAIGGGGIYNIFGTVSLEDSNISWNSGNAVGGGILNNGGMTVSGGSISNNNAANGGGVFNMGTMELNDALVENNTAISNGGGVYNSGGVLNLNGGWISRNAVICGSGGGIANIGGLVNLNGGSVSNNAAEVGGGILSSEGTVNLNGDSYISDNKAIGLGGGILNYNNSTVNLNDVSYISKNTADFGFGGGIHSTFYSTVNLNDNSHISDNTATSGGGIFNELDSMVNLNDNSYISDNKVIFYGGGIFNSGTMNLNDNGSISYNTATYDGGGIFNSGTMNLNDNSYIRSNTAARGGGIFNDYYGGIVNLNRGSIDHNNATSPAPSGGGIYDLGTIAGNTSIVHDNTPDQIAPVDWLPEV